MIYDELKMYFTKEQKEGFYSEATAILEDSLLINALAKRIKTNTTFHFSIVPGFQYAQRFCTDAWYHVGGYFDECNIRNYLAVCYVAQNFYKELNKDAKLDAETEVKICFIYNRFKEYYSIDLLNYTGDFIGCSHGCIAAEKRLESILKNSK